MILIAIGANLPGPNGTPPVETCRKAVADLDALPGLSLQGVSRWYLTAPVPPSAQPAYVNGAAVLRVEPGVAEPDPGDLLAALQTMEARAGRRRGEPGAARTLDLDIIAMGEGGQLVRTTPDPVLPHPRAHQRAFVLVPLLDVASDWIHPVLQRSAKHLLRDLSPQGIEPLGIGPL
jgi:2-amino-4-hydroxy-6-hydroxymethyldihydropteridine diphosphokinase